MNLCTKKKKRKKKQAQQKKTQHPQAAIIGIQSYFVLFPLFY